MVQQGDANVGGAVYQDLMAKIEQSVNAGNGRRVLLDRIFFEAVVITLRSPRHLTPR
jgi:hypothetical protein